MTGQSCGCSAGLEPCTCPPQGRRYLGHPTSWTLQLEIRSYTQGYCPHRFHTCYAAKILRIDCRGDAAVIRMIEDVGSVNAEPRPQVLLPRESEKASQRHIEIHRARAGNSVPSRRANLARSRKHERRSVEEIER